MRGETLGRTQVEDDVEIITKGTENTYDRQRSFRRTLHSRRVKEQAIYEVLHWISSVATRRLYLPNVAIADPISDRTRYALLVSCITTNMIQKLLSQCVL